MKRITYIVARDQPRLYTKFVEAYGGNGSAEVVLDRRQGQRRRRIEVWPDDRRRADRRGHDVSPSLKTIGWAMVHAP